MKKIIFALLFVVLACPVIAQELFVNGRGYTGYENRHHRRPVVGHVPAGPRGSRGI